MAVVLVSGLAASGWAGLGAPEPPDRADAGWRVGEPAAIAVRDGRSVFRVPTSGPACETLVLVSALTPARGPFPVKINVRPCDRPAAPDPADDGPRRAPELAPLAAADAVDPLPEPPHDMPARERVFHMLVRDGDVTSPANYVAIRGVLAGAGRRVQVYADSEDRTLLDRTLVDDVIRTFDEHVLPLAARRFGAARDVDGDGRFTVLLSRWLDHLGSGRYSVDGFVRVSDLDTSIDSPFSNRCDMMYVNARLKPGPHLRTVVAHEYMHAVIFSRKTLRTRRAGVQALEEEGWLDEAMAHLSEDLHGFSRSNIDYRIDAFLARPERYQLVVADYYAANLFRSHGNRGGTYLFLKWCVRRYGPELVPALLRSELCGAASLEAVTGAPFAALYRGWSLSLAERGLEAEEAVLPAVSDVARADLSGCRDEPMLFGPRITRIDVSHAVDEWTALGTTSHFAIVDGFAAGAVEIEVSGPAEARLQVTAMPLGAKRASLELSVSRVQSAGDGLRFRAKVRERHGIPVHLTTLAWEPLVPAGASKTTSCFGGQLETSGIEATFGTRTLTASGELSSRPIPLAGATSQAGPLVIKVRGVDAAGRRVAAWADLDSECHAELKDQ